jgi:hypothetical protein
MTVPEAVHEAETFEVEGTGPSAGPGQTSDPSAAGAEGPSRQPCPECGEMIVVGAAKCRFCNAVFDPELKRLQAARPGRGNEDLKQIANYQRGVILCIVIQILGYMINMFAARTNPPLTGIVGMVVLGAIIAGVVFAILLGTRVYSTAAGVVMGLLAIVPCLGLVFLLIINQAATKRLTENGIQVGFFGADMSQF